MLKLLPLAAALSIMLVSPALSAGYTITDIGLGNRPELSFTGLAINNSGQITGTMLYGGPSATFIYSDGIINILPSFSGGASNSGVSINSSGVVAGWGNGGLFTYENGSYNAVLPNSVGVMGGINDQGTVAGTKQGFDGETGFINTSDVVRFYEKSHISGINNFSSGVGYKSYFLQDGSYAWTHATIFSNGATLDLGALSSLASYGVSINDVNNVVGQNVYYRNNDPFQQYSTSFFWSQDTGMIELASLGGSNNRANDINNSGQIVGASQLVNGEWAAFVSVGGQIYNLNSLIEPGSGWVLDNATSINDLGQITGGGLHNGVYQAYILTPTPEPASWAMMVGGLSVVAMTVRRRRKDGGDGQLTGDLNSDAHRV